MGKIRDVRLVIIGEGDEEKRLKKLVRHMGIVNRVEFIGSIPFDEIPLYLKTADLFCFASVSETQGLVTMEAIAAGLPKPRCYVIDDTAPNAFASGRNPENSVIVVTTGLLQKLNRAELEGVIAHEMSHIKNYDVLVQTLAVVMVGIVALLSDWTLRTFFWGGGRRRSRDRSSGGGNAAAILIVVALALAILSPIIAQLLRLAISRKREFLADASGAMLTRYPPGLASALKKLSADREPLEAANKATAHLYIVNPLKDIKGRVNRLFSTHPPIEDRIAALEKM